MQPFKLVHVHLSAELSIEKACRHVHLIQLQCFKGFETEQRGLMSLHIQAHSSGYVPEQADEVVGRRGPSITGTVYGFWLNFHLFIHYTILLEECRFIAELALLQN